MSFSTSSLMSKKSFWHKPLFGVIFFLVVLIMPCISLHVASQRKVNILQTEISEMIFFCKKPSLQPIGTSAEFFSFKLIILHMHNSI